MDYEDIYACYRPKIRAYLTRLVEEQEAEDLAQEVFVKIERDLQKFRGEAQLFKNREIAEVLQISIDAVKIRLHRARRKLQATLQYRCNFYRDERGELACDRKKPT